MILFIFLFFIILGSIYYSTCLKITKFQLELSLERDLSIVILSDYHSNTMLTMVNLRKRIQSCNPDIIFLLGDITDRFDKDLKNTQLFLRNLNELRVPIFYILGNHEMDRNDVNKIHHLYNSMGIIHAMQQPYIYKEGINPIGIYGHDYNSPFNMSNSNCQINLLLTHSYENFIKHSKGNFDFIFSGHTHGGQVRIPGIGQIIGHGPTFFPKYSKGLYKINKNERLLITSGLGNSSIPIRLFNSIEILHVQLKNRL